MRIANKFPTLTFSHLFLLLSLLPWVHTTKNKNPAKELKNFINLTSICETSTKIIQLTGIDSNQSKTTIQTRPHPSTQTASGNCAPTPRPQPTTRKRPKRFSVQRAVMGDILKLKITALNCNSLNISSSCKPAQLKKIYAITKTQSDIILLSDICLSTKNNSKALSSLCSDFSVNPTNRKLHKQPARCRHIN